MKNNMEAQVETGVYTDNGQHNRPRFLKHSWRSVSQTDFKCSPEGPYIQLLGN